MTAAQLEIKSGVTVALAYLVAPLPALTGVWLVLFLLPHPPASIADLFRQFGIWLDILIIGDAICVAVEIVCVTPILFAFKRYRWRWLNNWSVAAFGFGIGFALSVLVLSLPRPGSYESGARGVKYVIDGVRTPVGWLVATEIAFQNGVLGLVTAIVFRLIAVRSVPKRSSSFEGLNSPSSHQGA